MGASVAKSSIDNAISQSFSDINRTVEKCNDAYKGSNDINIKNCSVTNVTNVSIANTYISSSKCTQQVQSSQLIADTVQANLMSGADAAVGALGIGGSVADSIVQFSSNLATEIYNGYTLTCLSQVSQGSGLNIDCANGGVANVSGVTITNYEDIISQCSQDIITNSENYSTLIDTIDNAAFAKVSGIAGPVIIILIIIGVVLVGTLFFGEKALTDWRLWLIIFAAIIVYLTLAAIEGWWPFLKK